MNRLHYTFIAAATASLCCAPAAMVHVFLVEHSECESENVDAGRDGVFTPN